MGQYWKADRRKTMTESGPLYRQFRNLIRAFGALMHRSCPSDSVHGPLDTFSLPRRSCCPTSRSVLPLTRPLASGPIESPESDQAWEPFVRAQCVWTSSSMRPPFSSSSQTSASQPAARQLIQQGPRSQGARPLNNRARIFFSSVEVTFLEPERRRPETPCRTGRCRYAAGP